MKLSRTGTCIIYPFNFHNIHQINIQHFVLRNIAVWNIFLNLDLEQILHLF